MAKKKLNIYIIQIGEANQTDMYPYSHKVLNQNHIFFNYVTDFPKVLETRTS